jgi:glycosyltransferase involved in cell wall biosynthesis
MRILQTVHQYPPDKVGGTEMYTQNLSRALKARGHDVAVFHRGKPLTRPEVETSTDACGVRVHAYRQQLPARSVGLFLRSFRNRRLESAFDELIAREEPDVVHFQHLKDLSAALPRLARGRDIVTVLSLHDYWFLCPNAQLVQWANGRACDGPKLWLNCGYLCAAPRAGWPTVLFPAPITSVLFAYRHLALRRVVSTVDLLVCPSEFARSLFIRRGFPEAKLITSENGIEPPERDRVQARLNNDAVQLLYLGSIAWQKGVHVLLEAFNRIGPANVRLTICGDETVFPEYSQRLRELAGESVEFRGPLTRPEVWAALSSADALVVPSLWYEVSPLVIQESFAARVPVIASRIGALTEKIRDGVDGLLFPPGDANALAHLLRRVAMDPSILHALERSLPTVKTLADCAEEMEALYEECLRRRVRSNGGG